MLRTGAVLLCLASLWLAVACGRRQSPIPALEREFVYTTLAFSPVAATASGLHKYQGQDLDRQLDDMSPQSVERQRRFYEDFRKRLAGVSPDALSTEDRADYEILRNQTALGLLEFERIQSYLHNPTSYVELVGNAIFNPWVLEYAPLPQRVGSIIARLQVIPLFLDQARNNLVSSPGIWTQVAQQENAGNIELIDKDIRGKVPAELRGAYDQAATGALKALNAFQDYLRTSLAARDSWDWRLGAELYAQKFQAVLAIRDRPADLLAKAELEIPQVRSRMLELALPLHRQFFAAHKEHSELAGDERLNRIVSEALERISGRHSTRESYVADARQDLEEARRFIAERHLLTLPSRANLQVIETPEFMRGVYAVGGFAPAPPLEPKLGAFYWITPIPADWPPARVESKLREYNFYKLKLLTIHEAMPGHYVQFEYANDVEPEPRRLLRSLYGNGPYIEGWGQYAEQLLLDAGFLDHSPELQLTFLKEKLRVLANAVMDIRLQAQGMTDQEALDLMQKQTFQESEEATAKLQRAKLTSAQLPTYFAGWNAWLEVRERVKQAQGSAFQLAAFNDGALREGAVSLASLEGLLTGGAPGGTRSK
ncbi:MAG TPA: DUF885 domain-containing protein [Bryobacteraceae bacterium]|nr:DUF885 domain-containing protein [Bryobacteraceae bacterium]